jgi:hypothetical protein
MKKFGPSKQYQAASDPFERLGQIIKKQDIEKKESHVKKDYQG